MRKCRECGREADGPGHRFCEDCGVPLTDSECAGDAGTNASPVGDVAEHRECREDYVAAVRHSMGDGVLDTEDRANLELMRDDLGLSSEEANSLESDVKLALTSTAYEEASPHSAEPLRLEINDGKFYLEGDQAALHVRVSSNGVSEVRQLVISAMGKRLGHDAFSVPALSSEQQRSFMISLEPDRPGEHVVNISLRFFIGDEAHEWSAQTLLRVLGRTENPSNLTLVFDQRLQGHKIGYGISIRNELKEGLARGLIRDMNDLRAQAFPECWQPIRTYRTNAGPPPLTIQERLVGRSAPLRNASLSLLRETGEQRIHLYGGPLVRIGRSRKQNDLVLRRLPKSAENDRKSVLISREPHVTVRLNQDGILLNDASRNGTWLNGSLIDKSAALPLDTCSELDVGRAVRLAILPLLDAGSAHQIGERLRKLDTADETWQLAERLGLRGLVVDRIDNAAQTERYIFVYRWVELGLGGGFDVSLGFPLQTDRGPSCYSNGPRTMDRELWRRRSDPRWRCPGSSWRSLPGGTVDRHTASGDRDSRQRIAATGLVRLEPIPPGQCHSQLELRTAPWFAQLVEDFPWTSSASPFLSRVMHQHSEAAGVGLPP